MSQVVEKHIPCPHCSSSDAYCKYDDGHGYCFSCHTYDGGKIDLDQYTYEYIPLRGLSKDTLRFYDIKTRIDKNGEPVALEFPYSNGAVKTRLLAEKDFRTRGEIGKAGLFGKDKFSAGSSKFITITEGELDAASLHQVLGYPVVSVQSSSSARRDCVVDRPYLDAFERVYIAFDGDAVGRDAAKAVADLFDYNKVYHVRLTKYKDANDFLQNGEAEELKRIWWNSKRFMPVDIISELAEFKEILQAPPKKGFPYPFPTLTEMTYGIRTGETVLITAQEKVGKTELMHAIEYKILTETDDNVGAIFLEEPKQRHLHALAGLHLKRPVHLPDSGASSSEIYEALQDVVRRDNRLHVYPHFGSDDPGVLLDTVRFLVTACECRYILFDHLSFCVSGLQGDDVRRAIDYIVTRLEMMVKELDFSLIMVSHVNDMGQTRDSRFPTKVADITINASRNLVHEDPIERNTMHLSVLYNRFCGSTGPAGCLQFDPRTFALTEKSLSAANDNLFGEGREVA